MKKSLLLPFCILALYSISGAQPVPKNCPEISVIGPPGVPVPGETIEFMGKVSGTFPSNVTYRWIVDGAHVLAGQGTLRIRVRAPQTYSTNIITATIEVDGLPTGCPNIVEASAAVCNCGDPLLLDEFLRLPQRDETARIDAAIAELGKYPEFKLIVIEYFAPQTSRTMIRKRVRWLTAQFTGRHKLAAFNFQIVTAASFDGDPRTKIYIVPPHVENPVP